jgi:glycosyltransferase involved in cell wall biosynthesis
MSGNLPDNSNAQNKKIRVLVWADSPTVATGFAQVSRNIARVLHETGKYDFDWVAVNFDGSYYDREKFPYKLYPALNALKIGPGYRDLYGRQQFLDMLQSGKYDLVFVLGDTFIVATIGPEIEKIRSALPPEKKFRWIFYFPIDATPSKRWIEESVLLADYPVAYTEYGYRECLRAFQGLDPEDQKKYDLLKSKMTIIYHGVNLQEFCPLSWSEEERIQKRKFYFGEKHYRKFIFMNLNRNQPRKDMFRSMLACKMLLERRRRKGKNDAHFYFHCAYDDPAGINLLEVSKQLGLRPGIDWSFPNPKMFTVTYGFEIKTLNEIYNCVDCVFSTTLGEGFGLSIPEAMATKRPVIVPNNTSMPEITGHGERGILVKSGASPNDYVVLPNDNNRIRPLIDVNDLVDKMEWVMEHPKEVAQMVERAYDWIGTLDWSGTRVGMQWRKLFERAYEDVLRMREMAKLESQVDLRKLKRNDICPICKVKVKKCAHKDWAR